MKKLSIIPILIIVTLFAATMPVAALTVHVDLGKTYSSHKMDVSTIDTIDLWRHADSKTHLVTTAGDGKDIKTLHHAPFRNLVRNFSDMTGTYKGITVTVNGLNPSTASWASLPAQRFYTTPQVPTIRQQIPGMTGNPMVTRVNESFNGETATAQGILTASKDLDIYKTGGILNINPTTDTYTIVGSFSADDYNKTDFVYTLTQNQVPVTDFRSDAQQARILGTAHPEMKVGTGSWYLSTIQQDQATETLNVYSASRVVALKSKTYMTWWNNTGNYTTPQFTFFKGQTNQQVKLKFTTSNQDIKRIKNITYLIVNRAPTYDIRMDVDTGKVAESVNNKWQNALIGGQVIDILYKTLNNDAKLPFDYTLTNVGVMDAPSKQYSNIAITPGYGISGAKTAKVIGPRYVALNSLNPGYYDIYLMGTDINNDVMALDQKTIMVV